MAVPLVPLTPFLRPGTTRRGRVQVVWAQFVLLLGVLGMLAGALAFVIGRLWD
jgi:hypothetical protein